MFKTNLVFITFCLLLILKYVYALQRCQKTCNSNGICYIESGKQKCKCLDRIYIGESCEDLVNHCKNNPCMNGGKCSKTPGQYNCLCSSGFNGQNCTLEIAKGKVFEQIYLQYNHVSHINHENIFLIILTDLGKIESTLEMFTPDYAIVSVNFPSKHFRKTNKIDEIAKTHQLPLPNASLPSDVFYYVGKYRMTNIGITSLHLTITDSSNYDLLYEWYFQFGTFKSDGYCNPVVKISNCGIPRGPVRIHASQSVYFEASIQKDCKRTSVMSYKWSMSNYFDSKLLHNFANVSNRSLEIPSYGIKIIYDNTNYFYLFKVVKLTAQERSIDGLHHGETITRCYVMMNSVPPIAKISGGQNQEYSATQKILMDGSESVDFLLNPKMNQNLLYFWNCSSSDVDDSFCKNEKVIQTGN